MSPSPTLRLNPPFRAEHVGSLVRPRPLYEMRERLEAHACTEDMLKSVEDEAIKHVVKLQQDTGIRTITDGELRRKFFFDGVFDNLEGMTYIPNRTITTFKAYIPHISLMYAAGVQESETIYCTGKIKRVKPFYTKQFEFTKSIVAPEDVKNIKITMCSPSWFHQRHGSDMTYDKSVYASDDEYFNALGAVYREEIMELYYLGCRRIQFDDPTFCYFCNDQTIVGMERDGVDPGKLLDTYIRAINLCTKGRPADLNVSVHMCRGNYKGMHFTEGGYSRIAAKVFNTLDVDTFYLEYDSERAGDFAALKHFPPEKLAVLGLVTTKKPELETPEELIARVHQAAEIMSEGNMNRSKEDALNQLCISTQCGFASTWEGNPLSEEDEKMKLLLLVETAKRIWAL